MLWVGSLIGKWQESLYTRTIPERVEVACRLLETVQSCLDMAVFFLNAICYLYCDMQEFFQIYLP
jgi:hypothetical protein